MSDWLLPTSHYVDYSLVFNSESLSCNYGTTPRLHKLVFSSRRRHTSLHGDWSSDVCSSDLGARGSVPAGGPDPRAPAVAPLLHAAERLDRKSVVLGKRVDLGGRRIIKKK